MTRLHLGSDITQRRRIAPHASVVSNSLRTLSSPEINEQWQKALDRCTADAPGAITAARTLLEAVCKQVLDEANISYKDSGDLPELYDLVAKQLSLAQAWYCDRLRPDLRGRSVEQAAAIFEGLGPRRAFRRGGG